MISVGHRGSRIANFTENTLSAFEYAIENKIGAIEVDLRLTQDGQIVIHHDETLERIYNKNLSIIGSTLAELKAASKGQKNSILTLNEFLEYIKDYPCFLEIKSSGIAEQLDAVTEDYSPNILAVLSFDKNILKTYKKNKGRYPTLFLASRKNFWYCYILAKKLGVKIIGLHTDIQKVPIIIRLIKLFGMQTYFYPINTQEQFDFFAKKHQADYICTDYAEKIKYFLDN